MAGKNQFRRPARPLQKARERLKDAAMILVRPEVGGIEKEVAGGDEGVLGVGEAVFVGVSRRQGWTHEEDVGAASTGLIRKGAACVLGERGDGAGSVQSLREGCAAAAQVLGREEFRIILVLNVRYLKHLARQREGQLAFHGIAAKQHIDPLLDGKPGSVSY